MSGKEKVIESTDSTQLEIKRDLQANPQLAHLSYVQAMEQSAGRGRQDNQWISRRGNLYLSVLYRLGDQGEHVTKNLTWVPLWVGIQIRSALVACGVPSEDLQLKWPNDLYYRGHAKLGGILCEKIQNNLIVGIGLNVEHSPSGELKASGKTAASLSEAGFTGSKYSVNAVRDAILSALARPFDLASLKEQLAKHLIPKPGAAIEWVDHGVSTPKAGVVTGLGGFGELHVMSDEGVEHLFSEEVTLKRI